MADDVASIQQQLKAAQVQTSAAVADCAALDDQTRAEWYDLAGRIVKYVSDPSATAIAGKLLRIELDGMLVHLQAKGCGNVAKATRDAPPEQQAPPPQGTPSPWLSSPLWAQLANPVPLLILGWLAYETFFKGKRR